MAVTSELPLGDQGRTPSVIVDDLYVDYRVLATGRRAGSDQRPGLFERRREMMVVNALKGISFHAYENESIGVIGSNGSGKSTLMRAITGLTPATRGAVYAASRPNMLSVGAALLPDLSGERNIILGGLALGMSRSEVARRFDDIVEFTGLRDFIRMPMRTYSSGMSARLKFAIATATAHDILIVDEALSVGDREFQEKSEERIREIRAAAGTVFLVSHSMPSILDTCNRVIWIEKGDLLMDGDPETVVAEYEKSQRVPKDGPGARFAEQVRGLSAGWTGASGAPEEGPRAVGTTPAGVRSGLDELFVLRTPRMTPLVRSSYERLAGCVGADHIVVVHDVREPGTDQRPWPEDWTVVTLDSARRAELGLYEGDAEVRFQSGDHALVAAAAEHPADHYWLLEADTYLATDLERFLARTRERDEDLLAFELDPAPESWYWTRPMHQLGYPAVYGCRLPVLRLSAAALETVARARRELGALKAREATLVYPNLESFVPTVLASEGFRSADLAEVTGLATNSIRRGAGYLVPEALERMPGDRVIYPAYDTGEFEEYLSSTVVDDLLDKASLFWYRVGESLRSLPPEERRDFAERIGVLVGAAVARRVDPQRQPEE